MAVLLEKVPQELLAPRPVVLEENGTPNIMSMIMRFNEDNKPRQRRHQQERAVQATLEVRQRLGLSASQKLIGCSPVIYRELYRDGTVVEGRGAMVVRATIQNEGGETWKGNVWSDKRRQPFSEQVGVFLGQIANYKDEYDNNWTVQHCVDPVLNSTPLDKSFPVAAEVTVLPVPEQQPTHQELSRVA